MPVATYFINSNSYGRSIQGLEKICKQIPLSCQNFFSFVGNSLHSFSVKGMNTRGKSRQSRAAMKMTAWNTVPNGAEILGNLLRRGPLGLFHSLIRQ
jgi:hypothetical protein